MDPLSPNDPLWKLLGKARPVVQRSNFTANVLREARNTAQDRSWWARLRSALADVSFSGPRSIACAVSAVVVLAAALWFVQPADTTQIAKVETGMAARAVADEDMALIANTVNLPLEGLDHMNALVAMEDTSSLSDKEIAFLLY